MQRALRNRPRAIAVPWSKHALIELLITSLATLCLCGLLIASLSINSLKAKPNNPNFSYISQPQILTRPELLKGIIAMDPESDTQFRDRLIKAYPVPIDESLLTLSLKAQGFQLSPDDNSAVFTETMYPCLYLWQVSWVKDRSRRIIMLKGRHASHCG